MNIKVSILVPVYNSKNYFKRCIDSILKQTYSNFELIIVDDGSTDGVSVLCDEYASTDHRVRVYHNSNHGVGYTRNFAIEKAEGDFVVFVDSDDYICPTMIDSQVQQIQQHRLDMVFVNLNFDGKEHLKKETVEVTSGIEASNKALLDQVGNIVGTMVRRSIAQQNLFPKRIYSEDSATTYRWAYSSFKVGYIHSFLYNVLRDNKRSLTRSNITYAKRRCSVESYSERVDFIIEHQEAFERIGSYTKTLQYNEARLVRYCLSALNALCVELPSTDRVQKDAEYLFLSDYIKQYVNKPSVLQQLSSKYRFWAIRYHKFLGLYRLLAKISFATKR